MRTESILCRYAELWFYFISTDRFGSKHGQVNVPSTADLYGCV
jgi:hypothetical protein